MDDEKKEPVNNEKQVNKTPQTIPKISKIIFNEKTGTVTLKIASEEEIAEAEKLKMRNEK